MKEKDPIIETKAKWFLISWMSSALVMYGLSYLWHGALLNDYVHIKYPMWLYFLLSGVVYLVIGLVLTFLYHYTHMKNVRYKGVLMGSSVGFFIYLLAFVLGVSFNQASFQHIAVDFIWQMVEQGVGGSVVAFVFGFLTHMYRIQQADQ